MEPSNAGTILEVVKVVFRPSNKEKVENNLRQAASIQHEHTARAYGLMGGLSI